MNLWVGERIGEILLVQTNTLGTNFFDANGADARMCALVGHFFATVGYFGGTAVFRNMPRFSI